MPDKSKPPPSRPRTASRVAAVQALFQAEQAGANPETVIDEFVRHRLGALHGAGFEDGRVPDAHVPLFSQIVRTAARQQEDIDPLLANALPEEWPLERLDPVLRATLRAAAAELWTKDGPPVRVVINEYLDITHGFLGDDPVRMVNAILDRIAKLLRPDAS